MAAFTRRTFVHAGLGLTLMTSSPASALPRFRSPQINLYSKDIAKAAAFYKSLGFVESFRTPEQGPPDHIELKLDGFTLGIATFAAARGQHGLKVGGDGRWSEVALRTDDAGKAVKALVAAGAPLITLPHDFAGGQVRAGWVADPDGNPVQIYQLRN